MTPAMRRILAKVTGRAVALTARLVTAVRADWEGVAPVPTQRVYFANHRSHADTALIWTVLPPQMRARTRPVAAADHWLANRLRRFIIRDVFDGVLVERCPGAIPEIAGAAMSAALTGGASLILFPEGTRNTTEADLLPLKAGLFHLAAAHPEVEFVPVWIENLNRVMPKGEIVPIPLLCTVTFGAALPRIAGESKDAFLTRAATALRETRPKGADR